MDVPEHQKSHIELQAQVASFAYEYVDVPEDKLNIYRNIGDIAASNLSDITRVTEPGEVAVDEDGFVHDVPEGVVKTVATQSEYVDYLRNVGGASHEGIRVRRELFDAYSDFQQPISRLREEIDQLEPGEQHPSYLAEGSHSSVYKITKDGTDYTVRLPHYDTEKVAEVEDHVAAAVLGNEVDGLERLVTASYEDAVTVSEFIKGSSLESLPAKAFGEITDSQLDALLTSIETSQQKGVVIDFKPENIMYDPSEGFTVIDFHASNGAGINYETSDLWQMVVNASETLQDAARLAYQDDDSPHESEQSYHARYNLLSRYRDRVKEHFDEGEDLSLMLDNLNLKIAEIEVGLEEIQDNSS